MKTAIFVDFDNVYTGLKQISARAANQFATNPIRWLQWLTQEFSNEEGPRRILVRRCYLNPQWYQQYRRSFHEAGFEIIDCPPMTSTGKTSTDIHLVLDAIDALMDPTHFDEFIVFSADADFSPLLRRLRRHDRRTVMFAAGVASKSYKAAADYVIEIEEFLRDALGEGAFDDEREAGQAPAYAPAYAPAFMPSMTSIASIASAKISAKAFVRRLVLEAKDPVPMSTIALRLQKQFPGILESRWDGTGSFNSFFSNLALAEIGVNAQSKTAFEYARMPPPDAGAPFETAEPAAPEEDVAQPLSLTPEELDAAAVEIIKQTVAEAASPVQFGPLGNCLRQGLPQLQSDWNGASTLAGYLKRLPLGSLKTTELEDGITFVLFDPALHAAPGGLVNEPLVAEMLRAADIPHIKARELNRILFHCKDHLGTDQPFEINAVAKRINETLAAEGVRSGTKRITGVLKALIFGGLDTAIEYTTGAEIIAIAQRVVMAAWSRETQAPVDAQAHERLSVWLRPED